MDTDLQLQAGMRSQNQVENKSNSITADSATSSKANEIAINSAQAKKPENKIQEQQAQAQDQKVNEQPAKEEVQEAVDVVAEFLGAGPRGLEFSVNEDSGRTVVTVMDMNEERVIRQIPSEETLELARKVQELKAELSGKTGLLFETEV